jgi:hypothetical protein
MIGNCVRTQDERGKRETQPALGVTGQPEKRGRVATWTKGEKPVEPFGPKVASFTKQRASGGILIPPALRVVPDFSRCPYSRAAARVRGLVGASERVIDPGA